MSLFDILTISELMRVRDRGSTSSLTPGKAIALPTFPDGRINYKGSKEAATVSVFIAFGQKLLLLKRSEKVGNYKGFWNVVAGYYDEPKTIKEKALEEAREEIGLEEKNISKIETFSCHKIIDNKINKIFYIFPVLITLKNLPEVKLDWEHTEYKWVEFQEIGKLNVVTDLCQVFNSII